MKKVLIFLAAILIILVGSWIFVRSRSQQPLSTSPLEKSTSDSTMKSKMNITSSAFTNNQPIPEIYTCKGQNINPPLTFSGIPANTKSLALIMDDPDAPIGTFVHWVVYNMQPSVTNIAENTKPAGTEGKNGAGKEGYTGPCPPSGTHRYFFKLYALDAILDALESLDKAALEQKMQGHIISQAQVIGLFSK